MKKLIVKKLIVAILMMLPLAAEAQLVSGIGIMGGITYSRQRWDYIVLEEPSSIKQKYVLRYNGEVFMEWFSHDYIRMVTELQYNMKGTRDRVTDEKFKLDYFAFNNYLKVRTELFSIIPYVLVGPRVEYTFKANQPNPKAFHFGWSAGAGFETVSFGQLAFLTELHYNPDINYAGQGPGYNYKNRAWELRVGVKLNFREKNDCPPVY